MGVEWYFRLEYKKSRGIKTKQQRLLFCGYDRRHHNHRKNNVKMSVF